MIPTEIVDHILSFLHSEQAYTTLETCSVVFPEIVDRHLYSQIRFTLSSSAAVGGLLLSRTTFGKGMYVVNSTKFLSILVDRPHIANYVRVVLIHIPCGLGKDALLPGISSILPILPHIESIALCADGYGLYWPTLGPEFCTAFRNSIRLPSIKNVAISNVDGFSLHALHNCQNLTNVILGDEDSSTVVCPRLSSLFVDRPSHPTVVSCMEGIALNTLSLRISREDDLPKFRPLIEACSTTLVNLELDLFFFSDPTLPTHPVFPDLRISLLDHIIFQSPLLAMSYGAHYSSLPSFERLLRSIPTLSPVRLTLHLEFRFNVRLGTALSQDWSDLAAILALPVFRYPIELYISHIGSQQTLSALLGEAASSLEIHPDVKELLGDGKLAIIKGKI